MSVYLDASVLIPLFVDDDHFSERATRWSESMTRMTVSDWTAAEFSSALSFHVRQGRLTPQEREKIELSLDEFMETFVDIVEVEPLDIVEARYLLQRHPSLKTPDALQLAIATRLEGQFATYDKTLASAARRDGLDVIEP